VVAPGESRATDPPILEHLGLQQRITAVQAELPRQQHLKTGLDATRFGLGDILKICPWPTHERNQVLVRVVKVGGAEQGAAVQERSIQANLPTERLLGFKLGVAND
jgi:hypothetical protein